MGRFNALRGYYKTALKQAISERDGLHCGICLRAVMDFKHMTIDHIVPLSCGGDSDYHNLQLAHDECNRHKGGIKQKSNLDHLTPHNTGE